MEREEGLAQNSKTQIFLMHAFCFSLTEHLVSVFFDFNRLYGFLKFPILKRLHLYSLK